MELTRTKITLEHNSPEWLAFRQHGIGGSDASAVLGVNPWKSNEELWEEKVGERAPKVITGNHAVQYGKDAEELLTALFALDFPEFQVNLVKSTVFSADGFMFASLDGELTERESGRKGILEVKTADIFSSMSKERWANKIPQNYYIQILHYLIVTGYDFAVLKAQLKSEQNGILYLQTRHYLVDAADEAVQTDMEYLYNAEKEFWESVQKKEKPVLIIAQL